jgi:ribosomal-protein-alanine N-acetyltransferase
MVGSPAFGESIVETARLNLTMLPPAAAALVAQFHVNNRDFMRVHAPPRLGSFYTEGFWATRLADLQTLAKDDKHYTFFVFEKSTDDLIGLVNFSNVVRGAFQACHVGYELCPTAEGKGLMTEALQALVNYMFSVKNFHRLMANYVPTNLKSERVLQKVGFQKEGLAKAYLFLDGKWKDHVLTSLINPNWKSET